MSLISDEDKADLYAALDDMWDTFQEPVVIVKEPIVSVNISGAYMPGWGPTGNPENFTSIPEQQTFNCLVEGRNPEARLNYMVQKLEPVEVLYLCVERAARNYILNGRKNLHCILGTQKYNITSDEQTVPFLEQEYFRFKIELVK